MESKNLAICWLGPGDLSKDPPQNAPLYFQKEWRSMQGRPLRGRLWVPWPKLDASVSPWPDTPLAVHLSTFGGLVIRRDHAARFPGIITDFHLRKLNA